jgi:ribosomal-protein-serine acetyltransferase
MKRRELFVDENIFLREIGLDDADAIFKTIDSEREYLAEWLPFIELSKTLSFTRRFIENYLMSDKLDVTFSIYFQNNFIGIIGFKETDLDNKKTEIGYWMSEKNQHKGIMTKSCKVLIDYAFDEMNLNRIQIKAASENLKSQGIPDRLGFKREGIERDGELHNRGFVDLVVFGLLKADTQKI